MAAHDAIGFQSGQRRLPAAIDLIALAPASNELAWVTPSSPASDQPHQGGEHKANQEAGDQGEVKNAILAADDDVSGEPAEFNGKPLAQREQ
jgi:hypothetical protein